MSQKKRLLVFFITFILTCVGYFVFPISTQNYAAAEVGTRYTFQVAYGFTHVWSMKAWKDNSVQCEIYKWNTHTPTDEDIHAFCGRDIYRKWVSAPPCSAFLASGDGSSCDGSYLTYLGYYDIEYLTYQPLPETEISYVLETCQPGEWCSQKPEILFEAKEPLSSHDILEIHVRSGDQRHVCLENTCEYQIPLTTNQGVWLEYWSVSSYRDESDHGRIHVRNLYRGANEGEYRIDILSPDMTSDFASLTWDTFPTLAHPEERNFAALNSGMDLITDHHLYYLAGRLIFTGEVRASDCVQGGLLENLMANTCGEEIAYEKTIAWQNRFNQKIYEASTAYHIPGQILKAVILQESQFWPDPEIEFEYGMGSLSEKGIDVLLSWDTSSYLSECISYFDKETCASGYHNLSAEQRADLRGLVLRDVGTEDEIDLIARVIKANTVQVGQLVRNVYGLSPAIVTTYEDLWNLSIANYHVGNQCVAEGLNKLYENEIQVTFENYCETITTCPSTCLFVQRVKEYLR